MKRFLLLCALALAPILVHAQTALPNLTYNASLNSTCSTPNAFCSGSVYTSVPTLVPTGQAGSALDVTSANYIIATVTVAGTYSGATINFDFGDPSGGTSYFQMLCTRTDANIIESSEQLPTNQTRAWNCPIAATYRFRVRVSAISSGSINTWITLSQASIDPTPTIASQGSGQAQSAFQTFSSTTTTQIIAAPAAGYHFYVTGVVLNVRTGVASAAIQLVYGTGSNCGTGTTNLTPAFSAATAGVISFSLHRDAPLVPGTATAICATQAGAASTTDVLVTGYTAP